VFARDLNKEFAQDPAHRQAAWLAWRNQQRQQGIDAVFWTLKETTEGFAGWDMRVVPVGPDDWDRLTPAVFAAKLSRALPPDTYLGRINALPATFLFQTREGGAGILQITGFTDEPRAVKFRYKLAQDSANPAVEPPAISEAELAEPPRLRFLAWQDEWSQDEWKKDQPGRAWHPDGSGVTDKTELRLLRALTTMKNGSGKAHVLHLWFSHPLFHSLSEVALLDGADQSIIPPGDRWRAGSFLRAADADAGNLGWIAHTMSVGERDQIPRTATVRLHYTVGPLEHQRRIVPDQFNIRTGVELEGDSQLNGIGQDASGKTFVAIAIAAEKNAARRFGVIAVTRDGLEMEAITSTGDNSGGRAVSTARFLFDARLSDIAQFRVGTRPIRTMEWKDVALYRELPPPRSIGTNACVARWPQGSMELVALSDHPSTNQSWWRPNGLPAADLKFETSTRVIRPGFRREFVIRHEGFPPDSSTAFEFEPSAIAITHEAPHDPVGSLKTVIAVLRADLPSVTLRAGLAEFRNVSLQAGYRTKVEVRDAE
jgi:hypothetical protein